MLRPSLTRAFLATGATVVLVSTTALSATALPVLADADERIDAPSSKTLSVPEDVDTPTVSREGVSAIAAPLVAWPVGAGAAISDSFGHRTAPTAGASTEHQGVDFDPGAGFPVRAAATGVVTETVLADRGGCGVAVRIDHDLRGERVSTVYCHLTQGSVRVAPGQTVAVGTTIATVGNTGVSTGAHLHFEVRPGGGAAVDPIAWLRSHTA